MKEGIYYYYYIKLVKDVASDLRIVQQSRRRGFVFLVFGVCRILHVCLNICIVGASTILTVLLWVKRTKATLRKMYLSCICSKASASERESQFRQDQISITLDRTRLASATACICLVFYIPHTH
jgi:arginine exporter protein ArgO